MGKKFDIFYKMLLLLFLGIIALNSVIVAIQLPIIADNIDLLGHIIRRK